MAARIEVREAQKPANLVKVQGKMREALDLLRAERREHPDTEDARTYLYDAYNELTRYINRL